jgi:hypothetical protein
MKHVALLGTDARFTTQSRPYLMARHIEKLT